MNYGRARQLMAEAIEAISERLVDDPVSPGQEKAPPILRPKPTPPIRDRRPHKKGLWYTGGPSGTDPNRDTTMPAHYRDDPF